MLKSPRVLVLGGSGAVGRRLIADLARTRPDLAVTLASRRPEAVTDLPPGVVRLALDVEDRDAVRTALETHDLAVVTTGPFGRFGASIHKLCVEAGVDVVDINDSHTAATAILDLDRACRGRGVRILTGMGFVPGLSTLLLCRLARNRRNPTSHDYVQRLYMGARNGGGPSNAHVLLEGFRRRLPALANGRTVDSPASWSGAGSRVRFPGSKKPLGLLPFANPEAVTLPATGGTEHFGIRTLDSRYHVQFLPRWLVRTLSVSGVTGRAGVLETLARSFHRSGERMRTRADADDMTTLIVEPADGGEGLMVHGPIATSHLTAAMAAAAVLYHLEQGTALAPGVFPVERLLATDPDADDRFAAVLAGRGVAVVPAVHAPDDHRGQAGDSSTSDGTPQSLRHFGCCWYSLPAVPPAVKRRQQDCLKRSDLWRAVGERCSPAVRLVLLARMQRRARRYRALLTAQTLPLRTDPGTAARIVHDFALFAAGYTEARLVLGEAACDLYSAMFLDSGAMEMAWLWPSGRVLAGAADPPAVLAAYLRAYVDTSVAMGVMEARWSETDGGFRLEVERCTYALMLERLECPELGGLVRAMEVAAIRDLAMPCGLDVAWAQGGTPGTGVLTATPAVRAAGAASHALSLAEKVLP